MIFKLLKPCFTLRASFSFFLLFLPLLCLPFSCLSLDPKVDDTTTTIVYNFKPLKSHFEIIEMKYELSFEKKKKSTICVDVSYLFFLTENTCNGLSPLYMHNAIINPKEDRPKHTRNKRNIF